MSVFTSLFTSLQIDSPVSYLVALVFPALDAIVPVLPSETAVIALGVATAGSTNPRIALLVACAAAGAFLGDNLCYMLGRRFGPAVERRFFSTQKGKTTRAWAERSLSRFGLQLIVVCRFIPGGRTAVTLTCGLIGD
jgi:membrane-associated protein